MLELYNLNKETLSLLLGWDISLIMKYLDGLTPSKACNDQLKVLITPKKMLELFEKNKNNLPQVKQKKLLHHICQLIEKEAPFA